MGLGTFFGRLLGRTDDTNSRSAAKDRLRLVLMHDRTDIPATMMEAIRAEMVGVLSKYVEIDQEALNFQLERDDGAIGLVLNIPILRVKTELEAAEALEAMHALQRTADDHDAEPSGADSAEPEAAPAEAVDTPEEFEAEQAGAPLADAEPEEPAAPAEAAEVEAKEEADEPEPVAAAPAESSGTRSVTVPVRLFSNLKAPDIATSPLFASRSEEDNAGEERPRVVRDAWYSAEELLTPASSERNEPND